MQTNYQSVRRHVPSPKLRHNYSNCIQTITAVTNYSEKKLICALTHHTTIHLNVKNMLLTIKINYIEVILILYYYF